MKIQKATENDIPLIRNLAKKSWEVSYKGIISDAQIAYMLSTMYSAEEILSQMQNPNYHYFLIGENENFYGFIGFEFHYEPETTKLHRIYLVSEAKGKGFGKLALEFLKNEVKNRDKRIILNVNKENRAKQFYESQGFSVHKEIVVDIGNGFVMDDYEMEFFVLKN